MRLRSRTFLSPMCPPALPPMYVSRQHCVERTKPASVSSQATHLCRKKKAGDVTKESYSYVGQAVLTTLEQHPGARGYAWDMVADMSLEEIVQTPPGHIFDMCAAPLTFGASCSPPTSDCNADFGLLKCSSDAYCSTGTCMELNATVTTPGGIPQKLCMGIADSFVDHFYGTMILATEIIDLTSLDSPDFAGYSGASGTGRFLAAVRNAITYLSNTARAIRIRLLFGHIHILTWASLVNTTQIIAFLSRDLPPSSQVELHAGAYREGIQSWNHGKIAIDNQAFYVRSQNFYYANLAEFGIIVDDMEATERMISEYFQPQWANAKF